jgi:NitT/TauT family transport system ATP-binding protein
VIFQAGVDGAATRPDTPDHRPAAQPLIDLRRVNKRYANGTVALSDISLRVMPGEFVTLVGPSGCGKSTVLRIIAGLGAVTSGQVAVDGQPPARARAGSHEMSFVFQEPTLLPWQTVQGNAELPMKLRGVSKDERARVVSEKLKLVGLDSFAKVYPRELSGGMKMRVSIARALTLEPKVLLMDEPFGALDEITRQRLNDELLELWRVAGCTVLFVTHNVFEAVFLSTRVLVMSSRPGRIVEELVVDEPYPRPPEFRTSPRFTALAARLFASLRQA